MTLPPDDQPTTPPAPTYGGPPPPTYGAPPPSPYGSTPAYGSFQPPSQPPTTPGPESSGGSNRTPLIVALVAVAVVLLGGVGAFVLMSDDDQGATTVAARQETTDTRAMTEPTVEVDGDDLPIADDDADDPALGLTIPMITGVDHTGKSLTIRPEGPQLIVVMAHWCPHCQAEIPRVVEWANDGLVPSDVEIVGVSTAVDEARGNYPPASWLARENWKFPVLADDDETTALNALGVSGFPTFIAVDEDGRVAARYSGEADRPQFTQLIQAALDGAPEAAVSESTDDSAGSEFSADCPPVDGAARPTRSFTSSPPMCIDPDGAYEAVLTTNLGEFTIALDAENAPRTVNNFVFLARHRFYDGLDFHRVIAGFVFQGGDPEGDGSGGPGYEFDDELPSSEYRRYDVAMANAGPDTNGSQFFVITGADGEALPPAYSRFGTVTAGTDVADAIGSVATDGNDHPLDDVTIESVEIVEG